MDGISNFQIREVSRMKVVIVGPTYPYKGGIAQYTSQLFNAVSEKHDASLISYKMQYPKLLFKKEQRDYSNDMFKVDEAEFLINTANPFNIIGVARKIRKSKPNAVIIQWWHPYFAPCYKILTNHLGKKTKVIFTCHNVFPHERFPMDRFLTKLVMKSGDGFIVHSKSDGRELISIDDSFEFVFSPLPTFSTFKHRILSKNEALSELNNRLNTAIQENDNVLLFFGLVREYKGLKHLLKALPEVITENKNVKLIIAGSFGDDKQVYLDLINDDIRENVVIVDDYIPDDEVDMYFESADLVVLPYESATQSAVVQTAFGFEKPVLVTNVGGLPDVVDNLNTGYIVESQNSAAIAEAIMDFFNNNRYDEMHKSVIEAADRFSWKYMVDSIEKLME